MDEELLYRQLPHSLEAEQAVLGSMLINADCIKDVMEKLYAPLSIQTDREIQRMVIFGNTIPETIQIYNRIGIKRKELFCR